MADQPTEARLALYRKLSTEHLQTLLRSDLDGPPLDEATVDSILTVLAERRRTPADTSAAWQDFSAYYSTPDSPGAPVRRTRAHLQKAYTRLRIPIRVVSAAAAMFILIFALFPRVETGASDAPNAYITWTDEYLKIDALPHAGWSLPQGGEYHTDNAGLQQLHDALAAYGVTGVVPSWVPEGAVLAEYDFGDEFAGTTSFYAFFSLPDGTGFSMDFTIFAEPSAMEGSWIVKDERPVSYFTLGDVGYYQYTNNASTGICWLNGCVSGLVCGKVPAEVIRSIVYSIHYTEVSMKRVLSLVLILSLLAAALCLPAAARSSDYISRSDALIAKSGTNSISIKTTTGSGSSMTSIGVTTIVIEQSANGTSWTPVRTYSSRYTAAMLGHNVMTHTYTQTYTGPVNYSYRALVTFYAADKNGSDSFSLYSAVVRL